MTTSVLRPPLRRIGTCMTYFEFRVKEKASFLRELANPLYLSGLTFL